MSDNQRKYEFTGKTKEINGHTLHQIRAVRDFRSKIFSISAGNLGGWIEKESNLSHEGNCWILLSAMAYGNAKVCGGTVVGGNVEIYDHALVSGTSSVHGNVIIYKNAQIHGDTVTIYGNSRIGKDAVISSEDDFITFINVGSRRDTTTFYKTESGCSVCCGCFEGTINEFEAAVEKTHGDNKYGREYKTLINAARIHFDICETINPQLKTFGYVDEDNYGIECGVIIADSMEEARQFISHSDRSEEKRVFEINSNEKGYTYLGSYDE